MGARGNSGVILSQLWRGFARSLDERTEVDAQGLAAALAEARDTAYKGVVRPVEGTILTVSKDVAEAARQALESGADSGLEILEAVVRAADELVATDARSAAGPEGRRGRGLGRQGTVLHP